jgi:Spy/CpxP family protein refolding chaperone
LALRIHKNRPVTAPPGQKTGWNKNQIKEHPPMRTSIQILSLNLLALAVFGSAFVAVAQPAPDASAGAPQERFQFARRGEADGPPAGSYQFLRVMNQEQRTQYRAAVEANREKTRELMNRLRDARREMNALMVGEKFDEAAYRAKAGAAAQIQVQIDLLNAQAFVKIRPSLTGDQIDQIKSSPLMPRPSGESGGPPPTTKDPRPPAPAPGTTSGETNTPPPPTGPAT